LFVRRVPHARAAPRDIKGVQGGIMKLITAVIKPLKLEDVCDALSDLGVNGLTVM
jgi:hypothetical protein